MFTESEKTLLLDALLSKRAATERSKAKAKNPRFAPIYDEDLKALATLAMKVSAMEVTDGKGKVAVRPGNG